MRIFRDLGYVEHLGNGLRKILSRYDKTVFTITPHFLKVIFRFENENTIDSACLVGDSAYLKGENACLSGESACLKGESACLSGDSACFENDAEIRYFEKVLNEKMGTSIISKTKENILNLFKSTGYCNPLRKKDVLSAFDVKDRQAAVILNKLVDYGILLRIRRDTYVFISPEKTQNNPAEPKEKEP